MFADLEPLALRVCSALGTGMLQGLLLAVGVLVVLRALPRTSAATRYAVAFVTLLTVAALPVIHFVLPMNPSSVAAGVSPAVEGGILPPGIPGTWPPCAIRESWDLSTNQVLTTEAPRHRETRQTVDTSVPPCLCGEPLLGSWTQYVSNFWKARLSMNREWGMANGESGRGGGDVAAGVPPAVEGGVSPPGILPGSWPARVLPIRLALPSTLAVAITVGWFVLALIRLGSLGWQCLALQRLKRQHQPVPASIQQQFSELRREMGVHRSVGLGVVADLRSPIAIGFFHPTILLPETLVGSTPADLDPMLRHELAHIRRRDDWTNLVQQAVKAVFFFHPGIIALSHRLNLDREIACDDHVLAATRTPRDYALFLTDFASRTQGRQWAAAPAAWSNPNQLRERIHMILDPKRNTSPRMAPMRTGILTLAALLIAATGIGAAPRLALDATEAPNATTANAADDVEVYVVEELTEPESQLAGVDAVRVEVTTSGSEDDNAPGQPKEKPARTTGSSSRSSDPNENENPNSRVIIRSTGGATSITPGDKKHTLLLGAPTPAPHPEHAPHPDARPVPRPPKPARIVVETRASTMASADERSLEERMRRLEKLVDSLARRSQAPDSNDLDLVLSPQLEGLVKSMEQVTKDAERRMRDAEGKLREAHPSTSEAPRERDELWNSEGAGKAQHAQRRAIEMQLEALRRGIESMQSQAQRLEGQLGRLNDTFEADTGAAEAGAKEKVKAAKEKQKDKSKPRYPDARPEQDPSAPSVQEPVPSAPPTLPAPPTPGALIRN
jgi:beta-lactamase regulating signal transducer with metallopeptidase domain